MTRATRGLIAIAACAVFGQVSAQDQNCVLAERYYALAQDSIAEFDENAAAGWLQQAAAMCPRFIYFQEFGEIRMQSFDETEKAEAVDAFINAHNVAETDSERAAALFQYASLLHREGETQGAQELIVQAQQLVPSDSQIVELAAAVQARIDNPTQVQTVRALGTTLYKPMSVASVALREYPWPPEEPSWRIPIDRDLSSRLQVGMSLIDVEDLLARSLSAAAYSEWRLYSAPGGFVMVTRFEGIEPDGTPLGDAARYSLPDDDGDSSFFSYFRNLFDAPEGYYRFIAFVVSDETYTPSQDALQESVALRRLSRGANRLPPEYENIEFTARHQIEALIYEFRIRDGDDQIEAVIPGRIPGRNHLQNSGLSSALLGN